MEALIGILGTLLGFALSELATRAREWQQGIREAQAVRALLRLEMELNLRLLTALWAAINPDDTRPEEESAQRYFAEQVISSPPPTFTREAYAAQLPKLSRALHEGQVITVFEFYQRLEALNAIRRQLVMWHEAEQASRQAAGLPTPGSPPPVMITPFRNKAAGAWQNYERIVWEAFSKGNPLADKR